MFVPGRDPAPPSYYLRFRRKLHAVSVSWSAGRALVHPNLVDLWPSFIRTSNGHAKESYRTADTQLTIHERLANLYVSEHAYTFVAMLVHPHIVNLTLHETSKEGLGEAVNLAIEPHQCASKVFFTQGVLFSIPISLTGLDLSHESLGILVHSFTCLNRMKSIGTLKLSQVGV